GKITPFLLGVGVIRKDIFWLRSVVSRFPVINSMTSIWSCGTGSRFLQARVLPAQSALSKTRRVEKIFVPACPTSFVLTGFPAEFFTSTGGNVETLTVGVLTTFTPGVLPTVTVGTLPTFTLPVTVAVPTCCTGTGAAGGLTTTTFFVS